MEPQTEEAGPATRPQPQHSSTAGRADKQPFPDLSAAHENAETDATHLSSADAIGSAVPTRTDSPATSSTRSRAVSGVVPPYWQRHERTASRLSQTSLARSTLITLEDHTADPDCETSRGLWARSVIIDDYAVVQGVTGIGAYVVWNCTIQTLDGGPIVVRMRYSEFDDLRQRLIDSFPHARSALPALPPKSVLYKFRPKFLESRRVGLEYFLNCVLLNPEFAGSPIVKDYLFGRIL